MGVLRKREGEARWDWNAEEGGEDRRPEEKEKTVTHVKKGTCKACYTFLGTLMNLLFLSAQAQQKRGRWQSLPRQIPRGRVRSYLVPILVSRSINDRGCDQNFPLSTSFSSTNHTLSVDIPDILENTNVILEMRNRDYGLELPRYSS